MVRLSFTKIVVGVAVAFLIVGSGITVKQVISNHHANAIAAHYVALANAGKPSPAPATIKPAAAAVESYTVPADYPRYLSIPSLGINARVYPVGLTKSNAIGTPSNVYDTAWYNGSSLPGKPGAALIDGHVSSWTTKGVFYNIKTLKPGDEIQVQLGDDQLLKYSVAKTQIYPAGNVDVNSLLTSIDKTKPGLNLITCTGEVIEGTNDFNERIAVYAVLN